MSSLKTSPRHRSFRLTPDSLDIKSLGSLREAFWFAVVQQLCLFIFLSLILDGGFIHRRVMIAMVAFWCFVLMFLVQRRSEPTAVDLLFIKYGIWFLIAVVSVLAILFGRY